MFLPNFSFFKKHLLFFVLLIVFYTSLLDSDIYRLSILLSAFGYSNLLYSF